MKTQTREEGLLYKVRSRLLSDRFSLSCSLQLSGSSEEMMRAGLRNGGCVARATVGILVNMKRVLHNVHFL